MYEHENSSQNMIWIHIWIFAFLAFDMTFMACVASKQLSRLDVRTWTIKLSYPESIWVLIFLKNYIDDVLSAEIATTMKIEAENVKIFWEGLKIFHLIGHLLSLWHSQKTWTSKLSYPESIWVLIFLRIILMYVPFGGNSNNHKDWSWERYGLQRVKDVREEPVPPHRDF